MFGQEPVLEESIYNILPPKFEPLPKMPMHKSKFPGDMPPTASTFKTRSCSVMNLVGSMEKEPALSKQAEMVAEAAGHASFGLPPGSFHPDPKKILQRCSSCPKVMGLKEMKKKHPENLAPKHHVPSRMPPVPRITEKPIMNLVSSKNFVTANAVENILAAPKKVGVEVKDYLHKEDYGKVPTYLTRIKKDIHEEYEYIRRLQEEEERMMIESQQRELTGEEQYALIEGLKAKWEKVNTDYQATTHITLMDSIGKKTRKEKYEAMLALIEKDIEKLNKQQIIVDVTC
jgi:hypothetical protein